MSHRVFANVRGLCSLLLVATAAHWSTMCRAQAVGISDPPEQRAISLVEVGKGSDGKTRYTLEAYSADLHELMTTLLRRTGEDFVIAQDVTGPISVLVRNATIDELLTEVRLAARPAIMLSHGRGYTVSVAPQPPADMRSPAPLLNGGIRQLNAPFGTTGPRIPQLAAPVGGLNLPVTLEIADNKPVPIVDALRSIERQTNASIRLDNRIPKTLGLSAQFTRTPLLLVLDSISRTGALKWVAQPDGSILIAPTDWLHVSLGDTLLATYPSVACTRCGLLLASGWAYCPRCGLAAPRKVGGIRQVPK